MGSVQKFTAAAAAASLETHFPLLRPLHCGFGGGAEAPDGASSKIAPPLLPPSTLKAPPCFRLFGLAGFFPSQSSITDKKDARHVDSVKTVFS